MTDPDTITLTIQFDRPLGTQIRHVAAEAFAEQLASLLTGKTVQTTRTTWGMGLARVVDVAPAIEATV